MATELCRRHWRGHVCKLPPEPQAKDEPPGQHTHECLCGKKWVSPHPYHRSPFSGSGNCWCGRHEGSTLHRERSDA